MSNWSRVFDSGRSGNQISRKTDLRLLAYEVLDMAVELLVRRLVISACDRRIGQSRFKRNCF